MSWLGAIEGFYGKPLGHQARLDLLDWMGAKGFNVFAYAPKDDPFHRQRWREPHPPERMDEFADLVAKGRECGVAFCYTISPGLDWHDGDETTLVAKLKSVASLDCEAMGVLWDDVPPGGRELGEAHARGVAAAVDAIPDARWWTVGTDYAIAQPTPYLQGLCNGVPSGVEVAWTGPSVVALTLDGAQASALGDALGRKLLLWENFPVNDGPMRGVLHLGPYPQRSPDLVDESSGVLFNLMPQAIANRIGLECGLRFWSDPSSDRERVWREVVASFRGLQPLARASRSWVASPGPDPELEACADAAPDDKRLREFLSAGCRQGLDEAIADEVAPWLDAWDREAQTMLMALDVLERGYRSVARGLVGAELWTNARLQREQLFGIRSAGYPVTEQSGEYLVTRPEATVIGENLTDRLCRRAFKGGPGE